jgi:retinol dehydrogenase 14
MEQTHSGPMPGKTVLVTVPPRASARRLHWAWPGSVRTSRLQAATASAPRMRRARSAQPAAGLVDVFVADLSSQADVRRLAYEVFQSLPPDRRAGKQRWGLLEHSERHR